MALVSRSRNSAQRSFAFLAILGAVSFAGVRPLKGAANPDIQQEVAHRELTGDLAGARSLLETQAAQAGNTSAAAELAEFLDRHDQPGRRDAYLRWANEERDPAQRRLALRQVVLLDFIDGRTADLGDDLRKYRDAGGTDLQMPARKNPFAQYSKVQIPGPLSSFARMAALNTDLAPDQLLPALARNIVTNGFQASGNETLQETEYLKLLIRYIGQARELQAMANKDHQIVVASCDSQQTGDLLRVLGYRMRGSCGSDIVLETVNPTRAFITIDSAFPLTELEQDLRANRRFEVTYAPTSIPVLYDPGYWLSALNKTNQGDFIDAFLSDPTICRLYLGLSHLDRETAEAIRRETPASKLRLYANNLDFYGGMFQIRNGAAVVPGSPRVWASLVGVSPDKPGEFFTKLLMTDDGWLTSYFDTLSRLRDPQAAYLEEPERIKRFYYALKGRITVPGPARPVFRSSTDLMLLTTSLRIDPNGRLLIPGDLDVWRRLFVKHPHGKYDAKLSRAAANWRTSDDLLEALFALSRKTVDNEPLKIFLVVNDVDRNRAQPISADLAARLIANYRAFSSQYSVFADTPQLSEVSINKYLDVMKYTDDMRDSLLKADTMGTLQALVEIWQILCRQNSIAADDRDATFSKLIEPFGRVKQDAELFDAGRAGVNLLLASAHANESGRVQDRLVALVVGYVRNHAASGHPSPAENLLRVFDAQRLISLDDLFTLADAQGKETAANKAVKRIEEDMSRLQETQSFRSSLSSEEKTVLSLGYWSERHVEEEQKLDVDSLLKNPERKNARAALAPFLRDSLVGIVYSYYAPVGTELLMTNPLVVRTHDFLGAQGSPADWKSTEVTGSGWPASAGGRLMGSLISLPYAVAEAEQNFLTPKREQALIWADLVPQMIVDVTVNRWRHVTPEQLRYVALRIQRGRNLVAAAAMDPSAAPHIFEALGQFLTPGNVEHVRDELYLGDFANAVAQVPTSELYALAGVQNLQDILPDPASTELSAMEATHKQDLAPGAVARAFGTPKPTLTHSYQPCLLHLRTFPALMGYSSRILAESWESNNLFYADLAYEAGTPASELDVWVPEWNRAAIENIFATHLEDWPALLRSLHTVGENVRQRGNTQTALNISEY